MLFQLLNRFFSTILLKEVMINRIIVEVTTKCNLGCEYCYHSCSSCGCDMDLKVMKRIVSTIHPNTKIVLTGGEPLCHADISSLLTELMNNNIKATIYTNGLLLSRSILEEFKRRGIERVQVSLDGLTEQANRLRNLTPKTVDKICDNIVVASKYSEFSVDISCVLSAANYRQTEELLNFAKENNAGVVFSFLSPEGNAAHSNHLLDVKQVGWTLLQLDKEMSSYDLTMPSCGLGGSCPILVENGITPYVDYEGNVYPCIGLRMDIFCLGNVFDNSFNFDFADNLILKQLKEVLIARGRLMKETYCRKCFYYNSLCNGGCLSNCIVENGDFFIQSSRCRAYEFYGKYKFLKNSINN